MSVPPVSEALAADAAGSGSAPLPAQRNWFSLALVVLVNLVPLIGIAALDWSVWSVLLLYWIENFLIGWITFLRILISWPSSWIVWLMKLFMLPFFVVHYGMFCLVHLVFLLILFGPRGSSIGAPWDELDRVPGLIAAEPGMALAALCIGGGLLLRMLGEFVCSGRYRTAVPQAEMFKPYGRVVVLHVTVMIGSVLVLALGQPVLAVLVLVALKLAVELGHWRIEGTDAAQSEAEERMRQQMTEMLRKGKFVMETER